MNIIVSTNINLDFLPRIEAKLILKRIQELEACAFLGEVYYGRIHPLKGMKSGIYSLRIGKKSRLLLEPFAFVPPPDDGKRHWTYFITGVRVYYSANHYNNYN